MNQPVLHPLTAHVFEQEEQDRATQALLDETERATACVVADIGDALARVFAHTPRLLSEGQASASMRHELLAVEQATRELEQFTTSLAAGTRDDALTRAET